jgi:hypothetical protein
MESELNYFIAEDLPKGVKKESLEKFLEESNLYNTSNH